MEPRRVSIVIPALNEAAAIGPVIEGLCDRFPECELSVVNNRSTDDTAAISEKARAPGMVRRDVDGC